MPEHKILCALKANAPKRLTKQFVALAPTELGQEIFIVIRRRLFVAFQPKQLRDVVVAEGVHARQVLARETDFIVALLNLSELFFPIGRKMVSGVAKNLFSHSSHPATAAWRCADRPWKGACNAARLRRSRVPQSLAQRSPRDQTL